MGINDQSESIRATFWQRFVASLIDQAIFFYIPLFLLYIYIPEFFVKIVTAPQYLPQGVKFFYYTWMYYGITAFFSLPFYKYFSATPGKLFMGLKLVDYKEDKPSLLRIILRELIAKQLTGYTIMIGYLTCLIRKDKQCLHDSLAQTYVLQLSKEVALKKSRQQIGLLRSISLITALFTLLFFHYDISNRLSNAGSKYIKDLKKAAEENRTKVVEDNNKDPLGVIQNQVNPAQRMQEDRHQRSLNISYNNQKPLWEKILANANYDLANIDINYLQDENIQNLIIIDFPEMMKTYHKGINIPSIFLENFFKHHMLADIYFNEEALKIPEIEELVSQSRKQYTVDDIANEFIKRIEDIKYSSPQSVTKEIQIHPLLINNKKFLEYSISQPCQIRAKMKSGLNISLESDTIKHATRLFLAEQNQLSLQCIPKYIASDMGFIREIVSIVPQLTLKLEEADQIDFIKSDEFVYKTFINQSVERLTRQYDREIYSSFPRHGRDYNPPQEVYESHEYQGAILKDYPSMINKFPHGYNFSFDLIKNFLETTYRPMRFFNSSHPQYKEIAALYEQVQKEIDSDQLKTKTILHSLSRSKEAKCCGPSHGADIRKSLAFIDEEILNDPQFFKEIFTHTRITRDIFEAIPLDFEYGTAFKDWLIEQKNNSSASFTIRNLNVRDFPRKLQEDAEFMKKYQERR